MLPYLIANILILKIRCLFKIIYGEVLTKITVQNMDIEENDIILKCKSIDDEMLHILSFIKSRSQKLCVFKEKKALVI